MSEVGGTRTGTGAGAVPAGWEGILAPGERILWQGRPEASFRLEPAHVVTGLAGLAMLGFILWGFLPAALSGRGAWSFVLLPGLLVLGIIVWGPLWTLQRRRGTWYTLTDRRAFIATRLPLLGRDLERWTIRPQSRIRWDGNDPGTVWFATRTERIDDRSHEVPVGFERIAGAGEVFALMERLRRGGGGADPDRDGS